MWTDDHEPPTPTRQWKPGATVEYTRTMFIPKFPVRRARRASRSGLFSPSNGERLPLAGETRRACGRTGSRRSTCGCRATTCSSSSATAGTRPRSATKAGSSGSGRRRTRRCRSATRSATSSSILQLDQPVDGVPRRRSRSRSGSARTVIDSFALPAGRTRAAAHPARRRPVWDGRNGRADHLGRQDVRARRGAGAAEQRPPRARHPGVPRLRPADIVGTGVQTGRPYTYLHAGPDCVNAAGTGS